ncbi:Rhodanese-like domain [Phytophthora cactorum]|nr:Rhodanese-like domain [Phytophthora cactorum]
MGAQRTGDWEPGAAASGLQPPSLLPSRPHPDAIPLTLASSLLKDPTPQSTGVVSSQLFADVMDELKLPKHATLVFYDDEMSLKATRMWWVFRHYGFHSSNLRYWTEVSSMETGEPEDRETPSALWTQPVDTKKLVGFKAVQEGIADPATQFDANGNARTGHVPGAVNFNWMEGVDFIQNGKFKSKEELDKVFMDIFHLDKEKPVITYCQRGIRAAHTAFALEQVMGFKDVKIYEDSMLQYLNRDDSEVVQQ